MARPSRKRCRRLRRSRRRSEKSRNSGNSNSLLVSFWEPVRRSVGCGLLRRRRRLDLEATEMAMRSALHRAGAAALSQLLEFPVPGEEERRLPCSCGQQAHYRELRSKLVLTALGWVEVLRPYYLCAHCGRGQFPVDVELDIENTEFSPGVRRMQAMVGQEAPFDDGREQMKILADLEVTTKSVERTAEAIGTD